MNQKLKPAVRERFQDCREITAHAPQKTPFSRNSSDEHQEIPALLKYILVSFTVLAGRGDNKTMSGADKALSPG